MWRPPERIRHRLPEPAWPTVADAARSILFEPLERGRFRLENRTWVPAMVPWRATEDGHVTEDNLAWYGRFARGRPGAVVIEATGVRDIPSGPLLRAGHARFVPGLQRLAEVVRRESAGETRSFIQLIDFLTIRRRPTREVYLGRYLRPTNEHRRALGLATDSSDGVVRERLLALSDADLRRLLTPRELEAFDYGQRERVTDTHLEQVRDLPRALPEIFAAAAMRAERAGFDGVELHYAHAYTMASFLSATNDRDDGYGGSIEERLRLPLEVFAAVRAAVGGDFVVGCRFLADECIASGSGVAEAEQFAARFAAAGMDFLSLSRGGKFDDAAQPAIGKTAYPYTGPSGYECMPSVYSDAIGPFGRNVAAVARIRAAVRAAGHATPIVVAGGISTFSQAEQILRREQADIIGAARQSLADPDWFRKMRLGRGEDVRRCEFTNYCEALDQRHRQVTCKLWDRIGLDDPTVKRTVDGRRRLTAPGWDDGDRIDRVRSPDRS